MRKSKFMDAQIVAILREAEAGMAVAELLRTHGISRPTFCPWTQKFRGASVSELQRLKALEHEHALPVQRAGAITRCPRTAFYSAQAVAAAPTQADTDAPIITALPAIVAPHGRWGFWKCFDRLRALGHARTHQRVYSRCRHG